MRTTENAGSSTTRATRTTTHRRVLASLAAATLACVGLVASHTAARAPDINPPQYAHGGAATTPDEHIAIIFRSVLPATFHLRAEFPDGSSKPGTGFIVEGDGKALTYAPLVQGASRIRVRMSDGAWLDAQIAFVDSSTGIAGLTIQAAPGATILTTGLGHTEETVMGEMVGTLGMPSGILPVISVGRLVGSGQVLTQRSTRTTFALTDALINPTTAGGPVIAADGRVIGIATDSDHLFIPITTARRLVGVWRDRGTMSYSIMGMTIAPVRDFARGVRAEGDFGAVLHRVEPRTPADDAGLLSGDRLLEIDGIPINVLDDEVVPQFQLLLDIFPADKPISVMVRRGEEIITTEIVPMVGPALK